jgi:hypothetical protein
VTQRVAYARQLFAEGHSPSALARILQISRQAIYRVPAKPPAGVRPSRPPVDDVEHAIVEVAEANPTDGYRIVTAWVQRKLGRAINRKRVLRVMRERKLIQRRTHEPNRRRPGFFRVERPGQLWHLDMTSIWVAEHGWVYLNAIIDCCTREIVGWDLSLRCRAKEAIAVIERAVAEQGILPGTLTLGTDNGSAFTARAAAAANTDPPTYSATLAPARDPTASASPDTRGTTTPQRPAHSRPAPHQRIRSTSGATSGIQDSPPDDDQADRRALTRPGARQACQQRQHHHHNDQPPPS